MTKEKTITIKKAAEIVAEGFLAPLYYKSSYFKSSLANAVFSGLISAGAEDIIIHSPNTNAAFNIRTALYHIDWKDHFLNTDDLADAIRESLIPFLEKEIEKDLEDDSEALDENPLE